MPSDSSDPRVPSVPSDPCIPVYFRSIVFLCSIVSCVCLFFLGNFFVLFIFVHAFFDILFVFFVNF